MSAMLGAYRSTGAASAAVERIVIAGSRPLRRWALLLLFPLALTFDDGLMNVLVPMPQPVVQAEGFCGTTYRNAVALSQAAGRRADLQMVLFAVALVGLLLAWSMRRSPATVVVVDRATRVLTVVRDGSECAVAFGEKPVLVRRKDGYVLHAGALAPIPIAPPDAPARAIDRLRAALATLDAR